MQIIVLLSAVFGGEMSLDFGLQGEDKADCLPLFLCLTWLNIWALHQPTGDKMGEHTEEQTLWLTTSS